MYIAYFDESGDDGHPVSSSELFVLTSIYFNHEFWRDNFNKIYQFRKDLKLKYGFPVKQEFHTREFITDKNPYHGKFTPAQRSEILFAYFKLISELKIRIISVVIVKPKIKIDSYNVLKTALTYNVQRIENDLSALTKWFAKKPNFMIFTDEGRVGKMRATVRAMQKINYIPSHYSPNAYRKEIEAMIEDVLPKNSSESFFIQLADMISFVVSLYVKRNKCNPSVEWPSRIKNVLKYGDEILLLESIKTKLNLKAGPDDKFGIVCYPK